MASTRVRYGFRWQAILNKSQTSSIWLVRVPSKPISHENGCHMHFLAQNALNLSCMRKQNSFERSQTPAENHRVRYGVRSELYLTLTLDRGVWESTGNVFQYQLLLNIDNAISYWSG